MDYKIIREGNKSFIVVPRLSQLGLRHCFTTIDMDMALEGDKSAKEIRKNLQEIYSFLRIRPRLVYRAGQVHSDKIDLIRDKKIGEEDVFGRAIRNTDGLITGVRDIALVTRYADCTPIVIFDPINKVRASIHSGWKGTLKRIGSKGVRIMMEEYNSRPEDLLVVLGPSIGREDFEVDIDVMEMFKDAFDFQLDIISRKNQSKYLIDLDEINRRLFLEIGIREENLININLSTYRTPFLHSFRRDREDFGLMAVLTYF